MKSYISLCSKIFRPTWTCRPTWLEILQVKPCWEYALQPSHIHFKYADLSHINHIYSFINDDILIILQPTAYTKITAYILEVNKRNDGVKKDYLDKNRTMISKSESLDPTSKPLLADEEERYNFDTRYWRRDWANLMRPIFGKLFASILKTCNHGTTKICTY